MVADRIAAAAIAVMLAVLPCRAATKEADIWALLKAADFHPQTYGRPSISLAGEILSHERRFEIWRYRWLENRNHMAGSVRHESNWLFVFERTGKRSSFLGGYDVDNSPIQISDQYIEFDYSHADTSIIPGVRGLPPAYHRRVEPNLRYRIVFGDNGPPTRVLLLDGYHTFTVAAHHMGVWRVLNDGNFSGSVDAEARVWKGGILTAGGKNYEVWGYSWEEDPRAWDDPPKGHKRKSYKVLVLERGPKGLSYRGSYERDNVAFRVEGRTVKFDLPKSGRPAGYLRDDPGKGIVFDEKGPPAEARINWVTRPFVK